MTSKQVFEKFVPPEAVAYCDRLYQKMGFEFKIKKARRTKLGDYRFQRNESKHTITINNDLNPYAFLVTYLHEVAHLIAFQQHGRTIQPHGKEWKRCFREIAQPVLTSNIFPDSVLNALKSYFNNPKAASCSDPALYSILKTFDLPNDRILLREVAIGETFSFNEMAFVKVEKKRTRSICQEVKTGRKYLISEVAEVEKTMNLTE